MQTLTVKKNIFLQTNWVLAGILVFTALVYSKALFNNFADYWDDETYILNNPYMKNLNLNSIKNIFTIFYCGNYHPLTMLVYLFEYTLFEQNPLMYHLLNILLHLCNTLLVYKLAEKLSCKKNTAFIVSLLFALHPMHVESVVWLSELKDMLYSFFFLLSLLTYLRFIEFKNKRKYYIFSMLFFIMSLLSKSAAVTLPVILIIFDIYNGRKINSKTLIEKAPFFLLSVIFGILAILSQQKSGAINDLSVSFSFINRIFLMSYAIMFYIIKLIAPFNLSAMYYYPNISDGLLPWQYYASFPLLLLLGYILLKFISFRKEMIFGLCFFLIAISVMLQFISIGSALTAERYTYISYIGLFYIIGQWFSAVERKVFKNIAIIIFFLFAFIFSFLTWERISVWKNGEILFTDVIKKNPENFHGYNIRGTIRTNKGDMKGALYDYNKTLQYKPYYIPCLMKRALLFNEMNKLEEALRDMNHIIKIDSVNVNAYNYRGVIRAKNGNFNDALIDFNKAITLEPLNADAFCNRGNLKIIQKDYKGAVQDFSFSLKIKPNDKQAYYNRGISKFYLHDISGACNDWQMAVNMGNNLAVQMLREYCK